MYYGQLLQSIPVEHFQKHELRSMTLEYRRECHSNDVVESLGSPSCIKPVCKSSDTKSVQVYNPADTTKCDKRATESRELSNIVSSSSNMNGNGAFSCSPPSSLQVAQNFKELKNSTNEISAAHGSHSSCDQSFTHLLRLQGLEEEFLRGRTVWKPIILKPTSAAWKFHELSLATANQRSWNHFIIHHWSLQETF